MDKRIWFITGISSGLGKALIQAVVQRGDFAIGTLRYQDQVEAFNIAHSGRAMALKVDITKPAEINAAITFVESTYKRVDVLVNNAGYGFAGAIEETHINEVREVFDANFFGALLLTQSLLPMFRRQQRGHIIQISSHGGIKAFPGFGIYNASKFALEGFSEALAAEVSPLGINVTIVEPGPFRTNFAGNAFREAVKTIEAYHATAGAFRDRMKQVNGKQEGDPDKAAQAIINIVSMENPPLRLPLGKVALGTIASKLESVQRDLEMSRHIAENAVYREPKE
jgi:NAD(P)-dependent dehydrogenase (short-subunit alcohol dehydrogenase family)